MFIVDISVENLKTYPVLLNMATGLVLPAIGLMSI